MRGCSPREDESKQHAGNAGGKQLQQRGEADRTKSNVNGAADGGEHETEEDIGSHHFRRAHLRIVQKQYGAERSGARRRKAGFNTDR